MTQRYGSGTYLVRLLRCGNRDGRAGSTCISPKPAFWAEKVLISAEYKAVFKTNPDGYTWWWKPDGGRATVKTMKSKSTKHVHVVVPQKEDHAEEERTFRLKWQNAIGVSMPRYKRIKENNTYSGIIVNYHLPQPVSLSELLHWYWPWWGVEMVGSLWHRTNCGSQKEKG